MSDTLYTGLIAHLISYALGIATIAWLVVGSIVWSIARWLGTRPRFGTTVAGAAVLACAAAITSCLAVRGAEAVDEIALWIAIASVVAAIVATIAAARR